MFYKSLHVLAPKYMCNMFTRTCHLTSRCLRNTLTDLRLPKKSSRTGQKCFSFRGAKTCNGLSAEGKLTSSLARFKKCLWHTLILNLDSSFFDAEFFYR